MIEKARNVRIRRNVNEYSKGRRYIQLVGSRANLRLPPYWNYFLILVFFFFLRFLLPISLFHLLLSPDLCSVNCQLHSRNRCRSRILLVSWFCLSCGFHKQILRVKKVITNSISFSLLILRWIPVRFDLLVTLFFNPDNFRFWWYRSITYTSALE